MEHIDAHCTCFVFHFQTADYILARKLKVVKFLYQNIDFRAVGVTIVKS